MQEDSTPIALRQITLTRTFAELPAATLIKSTSIWVLGEQGPLEDKYLGLLEAEQARRCLNLDDAIEWGHWETKARAMSDDRLADMLELAQANARSGAAPKTERLFLPVLEAEQARRA